VKGPKNAAKNAAKSTPKTAFSPPHMPSKLQKKYIGKISSMKSTSDLEDVLGPSVALKAIQKPSPSPPKQV
jgi:hypothetical protein